MSYHSTIHFITPVNNLSCIPRLLLLLMHHHPSPITSLSPSPITLFSPSPPSPHSPPPPRHFIPTLSPSPHSHPPPTPSITSFPTIHYTFCQNICPQVFSITFITETYTLGIHKYIQTVNITKATWVLLPSFSLNLLPSLQQQLSLNSKR